MKLFSLRPRLLQTFTLCIGLIIAASVAVAKPKFVLETLAETTQFKQTGRYDEVVQLCDKFQRSYPKEISCFQFGITPEGRPMQALAVSASGYISAKRARSSGQPVVVIQGGIHAGEIDGKDAGFLWLREALEKKSPLLKSVIVVFIPVFNVDGHERFGRNNRPNQNGPEQMGWRVTAQNYNLNRDYLKADALEMQAMLRLLGDWDPIVYMDLHVTDGAQFQPTISLNFSPSHVTLDLPGLSPEMKNFARLTTELESAMKVALDEKGYQALTFYPSFVKEDQPQSGFEEGLASPRFAHGYWGLRNRIGLLIETHSWKDYATRVRATRDTIEYLISAAAKNGKAWQAASLQLDHYAADAAGTQYTFKYKPTGHSHILPFAGYKYKIETSDISGADKITYDPSQKEVWRIPFYDQLAPSVQQNLPRGGYIIEAAEASWVARKLDLHGVHYKVIKSGSTLQVEAYRAKTSEFGAAPREGRQTLLTTGQWKTETRNIAKGSLFIPVRQIASGLIAEILEPESGESFLGWGFFNAFFEQKEYMESYVVEDVAKNLLKDPEVAKAFQEQLKDPTFAKNPEKRLDFFYRRHPSWDERFNLYPVYRTEQVL